MQLQHIACQSPEAQCTLRASDQARSALRKQAAAGTDSPIANAAAWPMPKPDPSRRESARDRQHSARKSADGGRDGFERRQDAAGCK